MKTKLNAARDAVNALEFGTPEWEAAMEVVRGLVDEMNAANPPAAWTDKEYADMMAR